MMHDRLQSLLDPHSNDVASKDEIRMLESMKSYIEGGVRSFAIGDFGRFTIFELKGNTDGAA